MPKKTPAKAVDPPERVVVQKTIRKVGLFRKRSEKYHEVPHKNKRVKRMVIVSKACRNGALKGGCHHCGNRTLGISRFAPKNATRSAAKRQGFFAAYKAYRKAHAAGNKEKAIAKRAIAESMRTDWCDSCRAVKRLPPAAQACKDFYDDLRKAACAEFDGCQNQACTERGMAAWIALQADHGTNPKARYTKGKRKGKPLNLSDYTGWAAHGGVPAMREEAKRIHQWICGCCHALEETSKSGRRCGDPKDMPDGKWNGTAEERTQHPRKLRAKITYPKQRYVNAVKREVGFCQYPGCGREVVKGNEASFDWNHRKESTKCRGGLFRKQGGVSGLVQNHTKAASLDKVEPLLDAEMKPKCDLLCHNCHLFRLPRGLGRWEVAA